MLTLSAPVTLVLFFLAYQGGCKPLADSYANGIPQYEPDSKIYNGTDAKLGQFPYQVFIKIPLNASTIIICGGTLIYPQWVLTAAHCVLGKTEVTVYLGLIDVAKNASAVQVNSSRLIVHPDYKSEIFQHDIALVKLANSVTLSDMIQTAYLPNRESTDPKQVDGLDVIISGWGGTGPGASYGTDRHVYWPLKYSVVKVLEHSKCILTGGAENNICTERKTVNSGPCQGDSGGPLVYKYNNEQNLLLGVTSYLMGDCSEDNPAGFTYVGRYLDFIQSNTGIEIGV